MAPSNIFWFAVTLCIFHIISAKQIHHCPVDCQCTKNETTSITTLHCNSLKFITKLTPKEIEHITSLDLSSVKMHSLDQKLKKLINLEVLNLSHNKLTDLKYFPHLTKLTHLNLKGNLIDSFTAKHLPITLTHLDISHNKIEELPQDITRLNSLKHLDLHGNSFTCSRDSLDVRDSLLEQHVHISGKVTCFDPPKLKGQSWLHAVDFDEYFKLHPDEQMLGDQPEGSGDADTMESSGDGAVPIEEVIEKKVEPKVEGEKPTPTTTPEATTTDSDFDFIDGGSGDGVTNSRSENIAEDNTGSTITPLIKANPASEDPDKHANMGTNIFLGIFLLCLLALLIYAVKKNKERKREQRKQKREERLKHKAAMELMPKNLDRKPSDKQNGNPDAVPLMNGQNGKSDGLKEAEEGLLQTNQPLLSNEPSNGDTLPLYQPDVKAVKVKASEIPDSVPQTPILVNRNRNSDGKIIVTPNSNQRNA